MERIIPEGVKPSLLEEIVYFNESDLVHIEEGYTKGDISLLESAKMDTDVRYFLEDSTTKRHPIPYVLLKCGDKYYLAYRLKGGSEARLHGKLGMLGGHVDKSDVIEYGEDNYDELFKGALLRELNEEVGVTKSDIDNISLKGYIRICEECTVEYVHLALVYLVELKHTNIKSEEEDILKGDWYTVEEIKGVEDRLEAWSKIVVANEVYKG